MDLQEIFTELLAIIGFSEKEVLKKWSELEKAYSKKSRYYHNLEHLKEMIACYETYRDRLKYPNEVLYAIFYHDYIYNSRHKDNELKSAEWAIQILPEDATIDKALVFDMILATKNHQCHDIEDEKWLIDFDLKILSKDWENYQVYFGQIRKEYRIYPDFLYKPGRKKALEHFLENEFIFQTDEFKRLYETIARENIRREIDLIA